MYRNRYRRAYLDQGPRGLRKCQDFSTKYQYTDELSKSCDDWLKKHPQ